MADSQLGLVARLTGPQAASDDGLGPAARASKSAKTDVANTIVAYACASKDAKVHTAVHCTHCNFFELQPRNETGVRERGNDADENKPCEHERQDMAAAVC